MFRKCFQLFSGDTAYVPAELLLDRPIDLAEKNCGEFAICALLQGVEDDMDEEGDRDDAFAPRCMWPKN